MKDVESWSLVYFIPLDQIAESFEYVCHKSWMLGLN